MRLLHFHTASKPTLIMNLQAYWRTAPEAEIRGTWCTSCYAEEKKASLEVEGFGVLKEHLIKVKNDEESEEGWVQCDQCERWVHQICGLFNKGRNSEETPYICPECLLRGAHCSETHRTCLPPSIEWQVWKNSSLYNCYRLNLLFRKKQSHAKTNVMRLCNQAIRLTACISF